MSSKAEVGIQGMHRNDAMTGEGSQLEEFSAPKRMPGTQKACESYGEKPWVDPESLCQLACFFVW